MRYFLNLEVKLTAKVRLNPQCFPSDLFYCEYLQKCSNFSNIFGLQGEIWDYITAWIHFIIPTSGTHVRADVDWIKREWSAHSLWIKEAERARNKQDDWWVKACVQVPKPLHLQNELITET